MEENKRLGSFPIAVGVVPIQALRLRRRAAFAQNDMRMSTRTRDPMKQINKKRPRLLGAVSVCSSYRLTGTLDG